MQNYKFTKKKKAIKKSELIDTEIRLVVDRSAGRVAAGQNDGRWSEGTYFQL